MKTKENDGDVLAFLNRLENPTRKQDAMVVLEMMQRATGLPAKMWGPSIIGFGSYHYKYASGREGDAARVGFSPRKANIVIYSLFDDFGDILVRLGKHKTSKACLYINKLADINLEALEELVRENMQAMERKYPA
ncbi:MAG: DUF1801 domain-containing protein [Rhodobacteraceae bacterium]|nr:DUF1801 domain-containing protein [Paracoccaceae bacterium]